MQRWFALWALGCAPFDGSASSASGRTASSLVAMDKLVKSGAVCRLLRNANVWQCTAERYFAASYKQHRQETGKLLNMAAALGLIIILLQFQLSLFFGGS